MSSQTLISRLEKLACPAWCDTRLHFGEWPDHQREVATFEAPSTPPGHGQSRVEVMLAQEPNERPRVVLFVSQCDGCHGDDIDCQFGDGESIDLTPGQALMVSRALSRAVAVLTDDLAPVMAAEAVRAA